MYRLFEVLCNPGEWSEIVRWRAARFNENVKTKYDLLSSNLYWTFFKLPWVNLDDIAPALSEHSDLILEHVCMPPYEGPKTHDDLSALLRIVKCLNPRVVLELGTGRGATVANICNNSNARVVTVNALPEQITGNVITYELTKDQIGSVYRNHGFQHRVTQIFANTMSVDLEPYLGGPCIDLAIIDACHDEEFVLNDFRRVLPTLNSTATVLFHDTHPSMESHLVGSYKACMALRRQGYNIRHIRNTWWAIWQKPEASSWLSWLK
jgi:hypothetical protein